MKLSICCAVALISASAMVGFAQNVPIINPVTTPGGNAAAAPAGGPMNLDQALNMLDQRGQNLKSFVADVKLSEENLGLGTDKVIRTGRIWYQKLDDGDIRFRVSFTKKDEKGSERIEQKDYVLDKGWLTERD